MSLTLYGLTALESIIQAHAVCRKYHVERAKIPVNLEYQ